MVEPVRRQVEVGKRIIGRSRREINSCVGRDGRARRGPPLWVVYARAGKRDTVFMRPRSHAGTLAMLLTLVLASSAMGQAPSFRSFTPESGSPGELVKIIGARLDLVSAVRFHGVNSPSVRLVTPEHLKAVVPEGAATGPIELVGPGGMTFAIERTFYVALPRGPTQPLYLSPPRPSPAPGAVTLTFSLSTQTRTQLSLFDVRGRQVRVVAEADLPVGPHEVFWDGNDERGDPVANGIYFVQLLAGEERLLTRF